MSTKLRCTLSPHLRSTVRARSAHDSQRLPQGRRGLSTGIEKALSGVVGDVNRVLIIHACLSVLIGGMAFGMPHSMVRTLFGSRYDHFQHELVRMYGALTLAQGWVVFKVRDIEDGRIRRAICEAFCIAYGLQAAALLRAQLSEPQSHTLLNTVGWFSFLIMSCFYGYCRWFKTIKVFELPDTLRQTLA